MSSPCAFPRLVRCRVRNLASCFYACRFPLDEEASDRIPSGKMCSEDIRGESVECSSQNNINIANCEPSFAEEDYIVFCFREDGAIHMINEPNSSSSSSQPYHDHNPPSLRPTNRKLQYSECVGLKWDSNRGAIMNTEDQKDAERTEEEIPILHAKDDEKGRSMEMENIDDDDEIKEINTVNEQHTNSSSKMDSFESCDSNLSDTSSSSFAFPVLGIEWIGSPVHMPKSENHDPPSTMRLHCCRF